MVCQRVNQILCGYEDVNDCDRLRCDSALKMSVGRCPSDEDLCSQATMTRLENDVDSKTLYRIGKLIPRAVCQVLLQTSPPCDTWCWWYERQYLRRPATDIVQRLLQWVLLYATAYLWRSEQETDTSHAPSGKTQQVPECVAHSPPGRRVPSWVLAKHCHWASWWQPFLLREFMDWAWSKWYVRYLTGLSGNTKLLDIVDKPRRRAENDFKKALEKLHALTVKTMLWYVGISSWTTRHRVGNMSSAL